MYLKVTERVSDTSCTAVQVISTLARTIHETPESFTELFSVGNLCGPSRQGVEYRLYFDGGAQPGPRRLSRIS